MDVMRKLDALLHPDYNGENCVQTGLGNYYGEVFAVKIDDRYYLALENYDGVEYEEIPEFLFASLEGHFGYAPADRSTQKAIDYVRTQASKEAE